MRRCTTEWRKKLYAKKAKARVAETPKPKPGTDERSGDTTKVSKKEKTK